MYLQPTEYHASTGREGCKVRSLRETSSLQSPPLWKNQALCSALWPCATKLNFHHPNLAYYFQRAQVFQLYGEQLSSGFVDGWTFANSILKSQTASSMPRISSSFWLTNIFVLHTHTVSSVVVSSLLSEPQKRSNVNLMCYFNLRTWLHSMFLLLLLYYLCHSVHECLYRGVNLPTKIRPLFTTVWKTKGTLTKRAWHFKAELKHIRR